MGRAVVMVLARRGGSGASGRDTAGDGGLRGPFVALADTHGSDRSVGFTPALC